jgi:hypothetical protein
LKIRKEFEFEIQTTQHLQHKPNHTWISFKHPIYIVNYCLNLVPRFGRSSGSNRNDEQPHIPSLRQHEV